MKKLAVTLLAIGALTTAAMAHGGYGGFSIGYSSGWGRSCYPSYGGYYGSYCYPRYRTYYRPYSYYPSYYYGYRPYSYGYGPSIGINLGFGGSRYYGHRSYGGHRYRHHRHHR